MARRSLSILAAVLGILTALNLWLLLGAGRQAAPQDRKGGGYTPAATSPLHLLQSPPARIERPFSDYGLGPGHASRLPPYPPARKGDRTPFELWRYAGRGASSYDTPVLPVSFGEWLAFHEKQKPALMRDVEAYMRRRYDFTGKAIAGDFLSGGKPVMAGPVARLPEAIPTFAELAKLSSDEIRDRDLFPYKPLAHPLSTTAHMLFPEMWTRTHPEHERIDIAFDIPEAYLPEFPPPLFLLCL